MVHDELCECRIVTYDVVTASGVLSLPWAIEGGFAVVYKARLPDGSFRALRRFTRPMPRDIAERYAAIGPHFRQHLPSITVDFRYDDEAPSIPMPGGRMLSAPIIVMEWVEGETLRQAVHECCQSRDVAGLARLLDRWLDLLGMLRRAGVTHGNLSGDNVMVRPDGSLVLVGYDGVFVPALAGRSPISLGQRDYQHPDFVAHPFDARMDHFPGLVIASALAALRDDAGLWDRTAVIVGASVQSSTLVWTADDFRDPARSPRFNAITASSARSDAARITDGLRMACMKPLAEVPSALDILGRT